MKEERFVSRGKRPEFPVSGEDKNKENTETDSTRRKFITGAAAVGIAGTLGVAGYELHKGTREQGKKNEVSHEGDTAPAPLHRGAFSVGEIEGRPVADLFALYLGLHEHTHIPGELDPDFGTIMYHLWQKKMARVSRTHPDWRENIKRAEEHFGERYIEEWKEGNFSKQTLPELVTEARTVVERTRENFHWEHFNENHQYGHLFGPIESDLVHELSKRITPEMLIAYSITELMPYEGETDPKLRRLPLKVYELLLEHAGKEFLVDLPSLNDPRLSVGMFQFTSFALFDDGHETRGASRLNALVHNPAHRLPSSVLELDTAEKQIRAAYLLSLDNLAHLVQQIANDKDQHRSAKRMRILTEKGHTMNAGLLQYIASADHNPTEALSAFIAWIDNDFRGSHADLCGPRIKNYVRSAYVNYEELNKLRA